VSYDCDAMRAEIKMKGLVGEEAVVCGGGLKQELARRVFYVSDDFHYDPSTKFLSFSKRGSVQLESALHPGCDQCDLSRQRDMWRGRTTRAERGNEP